MTKTKIIAVANQKGGVGKTTTTMNLASGLKEKDRRVLMVDLDPQANLTEYCNFQDDGRPTIGDLMTAEVNGTPVDTAAAIRTNAEGVDYVPSNVLLSSADFFLITAMNRERVLSNILANEAFQSYDFILIDCLPSLGILLVNALAASDSVLIPVQAQKFALDGIRQLLHSMETVRRNINSRLKVVGIFPTMTDQTVMCREVIRSLRENYRELFLDTPIRRSVDATNSTYAQQSLITMGSRLGKEYQVLTEMILAKEGA